MDTQTPIRKRNELLAEHLIKALNTRKMEGYYTHTKEEALSLALSLIPEGTSVGWGGSMSTEAIGLNEAIRQGNYEAIDRDTAKTPKEREAMLRACFSAHTFIMSTNALTEDGILVNLDGLGNRVAALIFGPEQVIVVAGMNKVVATLEDAISRTRTVASPINAQRFPGTTPCRRNGTCKNCLEPDCICCQLVITRMSKIPNRIKVILVDEELGF